MTCFAEANAGLIQNGVTLGKPRPKIIWEMIKNSKGDLLLAFSGPSWFRRFKLGQVCDHKGGADAV